MSIEHGTGDRRGTPDVFLSTTAVHDMYKERTGNPCLVFTNYEKLLETSSNEAFQTQTDSIYWFSLRWDLPLNCGKFQGGATSARHMSSLGHQMAS